MSTKTTERATAEALDEGVPGELLATSKGRPWRDLFVQIFARRAVQETLIIPSVPEPLLVWVLSGTARVEERELKGPWKMNRVQAGDFFLTTSPRPCELRWVTEGDAPFEVMHIYVGLNLMKRALRDVHGSEGVDFSLREVSGANDPTLSSLLDPLRVELMTKARQSSLLVQGIAQALAVHIVRSYSDGTGRRRVLKGGLPAFKLHRVIGLLEDGLDKAFRLQPLARMAGLSEFHFSRAFKKTTGFTPSQYFIRMRVERARRLLRETQMPVIDVGLEVGYASPSHFAQVFKREVGVPPTEYRDQS